MAKKTKSKTEWTSSSGLTVTLKRPNAMEVQRIQGMVKMPDPPTYVTTTISGRKETHIMDAEAAEQTEGGKEILAKYEAAVEAAETERSILIINYIFLKVIEVDLPDADSEWDADMAAIGIAADTRSPQERKIDYLYSAIPMDDIPGLTEKVLSLIPGAKEETITGAVDSFPDQVHSESEG